MDSSIPTPLVPFTVLQHIPVPLLLSKHYLLLIYLEYNMKAYDEWLEVQAELRSLKSRELKLRDKICTKILEEKLEGSVTVRKPGYKVTATARVNRVIDRDMLEALWADLDPGEQECIDYKPNLVLANYKKVEATGGKLMEAVTVKPGQASLKIELLED
jgi:hypothetical protein